MPHMVSKRSLTFARGWHILYLDDILNIIAREGGRMGIQKTFKALSDSTRRQILELLKDGALSAGDIAAHFHMTAATISHHLSVLKDAELVSDEKQGKYIYYELNMSVMDELIRWLASFQGGNDDAK